MWRRLLLLICVVFVLGLAGEAGAELVAHYPFDDGTADDRAYYYEDADGTFFDDAEVTDDAERGSVLSLDGMGDYVKVLNNEVANFSTESFTFSFWAQCSTLSSWYYFWRGTVFDGLKGVNCFHDVDSGEVRFTLYDMPGEPGKVRVNVPDANFVTGEWIHIACVRDADADELRLYVNGELEPPAIGSSNPQEDTVKNISNTGQLYIGADDRTEPTDFFLGRIDDFRVYNHALSVQELEQLASDYVDPNLASDPSPPDGAQDECNNVVLSWTAGDNAVTHDVYFGTDGQDVKDTNTADSEHRLRQPGTTYNAGLLESLQAGETYYWRIDEVGASLEIWEGDVWKFRINDGKAHSPDPADGRRLVPLAQLLGWSPGCDADSHDVYFGTDFDDVNDADTSSDAFKGNQSGTSWDPCSDDPCGLDYSTDYYWRIDEVNGPAKWRGDVWSFRTEGAIFDPNLRLWYKFNETAGTTARDGSGRDYDGTVVGTSGWDSAGYYNGCLVFDNNGHVVVPVPMLGEINKEITICMWLNTSVPQRDDNVNFAAGAGWEDYYMRVAVPDDDADVYWQAGNDTNDVLSWTGGSPKAWAGEWNHFAVVKDEDVTTMEIYLNGVRVKSSVYSSAGTLANVRNRRIKIGAETEDDGSYRGKMDDLMVYDRALTAGEIEAIFRGGNVGVAWAPRPYNGRTDVARDVELSWRPGNYAVSHDVYFGDDFDDVNNGTGGTFIGNQGPNTFDPCGAGLLDFDTTYYWRIDEVNGPNTWTGPVWSFTTAQFDIVDDFEAYNKVDNQIYDTWEGGDKNDTGAYIDLGTEPFDPSHGTGKQSMIYQYDNRFTWGPGYYSEAELPFDSPQDFTDGEVEALTLYFYGDPDNDISDAEQFYVGLEGSYAQVNYPDMNDVLKTEWTEWNIEIKDFNNPDDVDETAVMSLVIGFGARGAPSPGGEGLVYIDDIRLYIQRCVPEYGPAYDFSGNCIVDWADIGMIGKQWLRTDANLNPVTNPGTANLVGHWKLDEGSGKTANDSSVYANHGAVMGSYAWVVGQIGPYALDFSDGRVLVPDAAQLKPAAQVSASVWMYYSGNPGENARVVVKGADNQEAYCIEMGSDNHVTFYVGDVNGTRYFADSEEEVVFSHEWVHLAGTYDGTLIKNYVNGQVVGDNNEAIAIPLSQDANGLGIANRSDANNRPLRATVDDARVYNRALTPAEVAWLATDGTGYMGLNSQVNVFDDEQAGQKAINIRDVAVVLDAWLEEKLWPQP